MAFKLPKYEDIIKMSKEQQVRVRFDAAIANLEEQLINAETKISELSAQHPLDVEKLVDAVDTRTLVERRVKATREVYDQLFGDA